MLTRRALMATGAAATVAVSSPETRAAKPSNIIVMAKVIDDAISFDPAYGYEFTTIETDANMYRKLVSPDLNDLSKIAGDLAEHWEVSSDGKSFTFHLTQNSIFSSGKPLTAEDAEFSFHRAVALNLMPGFILTQFGFTKDNVAQLIRATDSHTLKIDLPTVAATTLFLNCLGANIGGIVEKATAMAHQENGDFGNKWMNSHSAGSGPYQLTLWQSNDHLILDANPHAATPPVTKRIFIRQVKEPAEQLLLLRRGDVDIARDLTSDLLKEAAKDPNLYAMTVASTNQIYVSGNKAYAPFAKPEVMEAIKWAIDYDAIQKNITPNTYTVNQAYLPSMMMGALTTNPFKKDPDKAKALLAKAGYPQGFSATFDHFAEHPYVDIATAIQADLQAIGIKLSLLAGTPKEVATRMRARHHQFIMNYWFPDYFDPNSNAQAFNSDPDDSDNSKLKIMAWRNHFYDPEITAEVARAATELDTEKRIDLYHKIQQQAWERSPIQFLLQQNVVAVAHKGVEGFHLGPQSDFIRYDKTRKA